MEGKFAGLEEAMRRPVVGGKQMKGTRSGDGDGAEKQAGAERERFGGSSKLGSGSISPATKLKVSQSFVQLVSRAALALL